MSLAIRRLLSVGPDGIDEEVAMQKDSKSAEHEWRCKKCGLLLGVARGAEVEVRYRDLFYVVRGAVSAECRRCGCTNEISTRAPVPSTPVRAFASERSATRG